MPCLDCKPHHICKQAWHTTEKGGFPVAATEDPRCLAQSCLTACYAIRSPLEPCQQACNGSNGDVNARATSIVHAQVMLQPRCLLVMQESACKAYMHSIQSQAVDTILSSCANWEAAQLHVGQIVPRAQRRLSLVFVHKLQAAWLCWPVCSCLTRKPDHAWQMLASQVASVLEQEVHWSFTMEELCDRAITTWATVLNDNFCRLLQRLQLT